MLLPSQIIPRRLLLLPFRLIPPKKEWKRYGTYVDYVCQVSFFGNWFIHSIGFIPVNLWKLR